MLRKQLGSRRPLVFGHRGAAGLAPENTLPSFAMALQLGADVLELDVHATRDGVIVVFHDPDLDRTTDGSGPLHALDFATLRQLDAGHQFTRDGRDFPYRGHGVRVPTLEEVLRAFPGVPINMEIKYSDPPIAAATVQVLRACGAEGRVVLAAERDDMMAEVRRQCGAMPTSFATGEAIDFVGRLQAGDFSGYVAPGVALQVPASYEGVDIVTPAFVEAAHEAGVEVHVWTINHRDEMDRLLALGVDGIMSDLPGLARVAVDAAFP